MQMVPAEHKCNILMLQKKKPGPLKEDTPSSCNVAILRLRARKRTLPSLFEKQGSSYTSQRF